MMMEKTSKKILFVSNCSLQFTGFGKNCKTVLKFLFENGYEIVEYATAPYTFNDPKLKRLPWKAYGALPDSEEDLAGINDEAMMQAIRYGALYIDKIIEVEKPDRIILVEDIWAFPNFWEKPWWNKIPTLVWTTLDSLPIYPLGIETAKNSKEMWVWSDFASREMNRIGYNNVKTVRGAIPLENFKPLGQEKILELRKKFNISKDTFLIGMTARNQLRKLFGTVMESFSKFKEKYPNSKLFFNTNWSEGWNLKSFAEEFKIKESDILTSYLCHNCKEIDVLPFMGQGIPCRYCGENNSMFNPNVAVGCSEKQLNEFYNILDCYVHPMTSGGQELTVLEAIMAGKFAAIPEYSCGIDYVECGAYNLDYVEYREIGSNFIKSQPIPYRTEKFIGNHTLYDFLEYVINLSPEEKSKVENDLRECATKKFSNEIVFDEIKNWIENSPEADFSFTAAEKKLMNPEYPFKDIPDQREWLIDMYENILNMSEGEAEQGISDWTLSLQNGATRQDVYNFFIQTAKNENLKVEKLDFKEEIEALSTDKKRIAYVIPHGPVDCIASLPVLDSIRQLYSEDEWDIFVFTDKNLKIFFDHLDYVKKVFPFHPVMNKFSWWEGKGDSKGIVDIAFIPRLCLETGTYIHNGIDINELQNANNN